jgi:hypothetical protein
LIGIVVVTIYTVVVNIGEWIDPLVPIRAPDPRAAAEVEAWNVQVGALCRQYEGTSDSTTRGEIVRQYRQLAAGRSFARVQGKYARWQHLTTWDRPMVDFDVMLGDVLVTATIDPEERPVLCQQLDELVHTYDFDGCVVVTADVVKPLPLTGGHVVSPCDRRFEVKYREVAFCED